MKELIKQNKTIMIRYFGFNTASGNTVELHDTNIAEIKSTLKKMFPMWSDVAIEKVASNQNFYKQVVPVETIKKQNHNYNNVTVHKESLMLCDRELNPIIKVASSIHFYKKNGYRYWGNDVKNIFENKIISEIYDRFEKEYNEIKTSIKNKENQHQLKSKVFDLIDTMEELKSAIESNGIINKDFDKKYVKGNHLRCGIKGILEKVGNF